MGSQAGGPSDAIKQTVDPKLTLSVTRSDSEHVEFRVETNLPTPLTGLASLDMHGQADNDTAIGTEEVVVLTGPTTTFSVKTVNSDNALDGKPLPAAIYDAEVRVSPKRPENAAISSLTGDLEAKSTISLKSGTSRASAEQKDVLRTWIMENVSAGQAWNEREFTAKLGRYRKRPSTMSRYHDALYFPRADMTLIVNHVRNEVTTWRAGDVQE